MRARMTTHPRLKGAAAVVALMLAVATGACSAPTDSAQPSSVGASPAVTARPTPASTPTPTPEPTPAPSYVGGRSLDATIVERYIIEYTNRERAAEGRTLLSHDPAISDISREHSKNMAKSGEFEHIIDGDDPNDRALDAGYDCRAYFHDGSYSYGLGENIALLPKVNRWLYDPSGPVGTTWSVLSFYRSESSMAEAVVQIWMDSPEHRAGLMEPLSRRIGVGVHVQELQGGDYIIEMVYATQNFSSCEEAD